MYIGDLRTRFPVSPGVDVFESLINYLFTLTARRSRVDVLEWCSVLLKGFGA